MTDDQLVQQKISWHVYKKEMEKICENTKELKQALLKKAKIARIFSIVVGYPIKILLGSAASGGVIELVTNDAVFNNADSSNMICQQPLTWVIILRTVLELFALVLVVTQDFFQFDTQIEKYYAAAAAIDTFYKTVKYQSWHLKGTEGDRLDNLLDYKKLYDEIVSNNQIIQTVEEMNSANNTDSRNSDDDIEQGSENGTVLRNTLNNNNRMMYLQTMLDRMPQ